MPREGCALAVNTAGRHVGIGKNTGWALHLSDMAKVWNGKKVPLNARLPRLAPPFAGKSVVMLVDLDTTSGWFKHLSYGIRDAEGAAVQSLGTVLPFVEEGVCRSDYCLALSMVDAGDCVRVVTRDDVKELPAVTVEASEDDSDAEEEESKAD
jgi:hypothetical protein